MNSLVDIILKSFSISTLFVDAAILILVLSLVVAFFSKRKTVFTKVLEFVGANYISLAFLLVSAATAGSLFLSEIVLFDPCKLCWFQRIFLYPQVIILGVALFVNDKEVWKYILPLSIIGGAIALYHNAIQLFPQGLKCSEELGKCSTIQYAEFGYITIPVMSLSAFILIILISYIGSKK